MEVREGGRSKGGGREEGRKGRTVQHQDGGEHILSSIGLLYSEGHSIVNPFELKGVAFVTVLILYCVHKDTKSRTVLLSLSVTCQIRTLLCFAG